MGRLDRIREARRAAQQAALTRWREREEVRRDNVRAVAEYGAGAADSAQRNLRMRERTAGIRRAREMQLRGLLPVGIERKMGPTLDLMDLPPSEAARRAGRPVARIVTVAGPGLLPEGFATGFLVGPRLLMTNHHVFPSKADAVDTGANFLFERADRGVQTGVVFRVDADTFYCSDERLDFALVTLHPGSQGEQQLEELGLIQLIEATPKILVGQPVNIIQHPEGGTKQYATTQNRLVDVLGEGFLHYETDTLEGSSGSPAFNTSWELVALHHAAIPAMRDGQVVAVDGGIWRRGMDDDQVRWIANEGTRVSAIVAHLGALRLADPKQRAILRELLATTTDPVDELTAHLVGSPEALGFGTSAGGRMPPGRPGDIGAMAHNVFHFSGPVTINVLPAAAATAITTAPAPPVADVAPERAIRFDPDYAGREGYDPMFLGSGIEVPVPEVGDGRRGELLTGRDGEPMVLRYHHFELVMNERRRLQMWSAVNVDYDVEKKTRRPGGRDGFGRDRWVPDPRIPAMAQIFDAEFYKPAGNIDRGHMVRREDNAWGLDETQIEFANSDTFHWTNCTPQHEAFNQSDPGRNDRTYRGMAGIWGSFENHIQRSLAGVDTKACLLAGPVLVEDDPSQDFGSGPIQYPLRFWKVVCVSVAEGGERPALRVFGFVFSQQDVVERFGIERFDPGDFAPQQVRLRAITAMTGVTFDRVLHAADTMADEDEPVAIASLDQIRGLARRPAPASARKRGRS